jgi:lysozyme
MARAKKKNNNKEKAKKKVKWWIVPVFIIAVLLLAGYTGYVYWRQLQAEKKARFAFYPSFGINLPVGYAIHGIDVSNHQSFIFWPGVKQMKDKDIKIQFAFIKATEGLTDTDKQFKHNWQSAKEMGIARGAYHYFLATKSGKDQALNFIKNVKLEHGDLPPVLDVEDLYGVDPAIMRAGVKEWLQTVAAAYKVKPIIYSFADFYNNNLGGEFKDYPLWVAHYIEQSKPKIKRDWIFWQHSDAGKVNGITTKVDFDAFGGDSTEFAGLLVK